MTTADFVYSFIPIFVAMDMGGLIPVFLTLTQDLTPREKRHVSGQALVTSFLISVVFIAAGQFIFRVLGISVADFLIAGGVLLLVFAIVEIIRGEQKIASSGIHVGVVPLGIPLIIGPAVLTSLLILISLRGYSVTLLALMANLVLVGIAFKGSHRLVKLIGRDGLRATSQVVSLFLAAIAVSMIRRGIESLR
jgi:multiple antibiotic resistance protein